VGQTTRPASTEDMSTQRFDFAHRSQRRFGSRRSLSTRHATPVGQTRHPTQVARWRVKRGCEGLKSRREALAARVYQVYT